MNTSEQFAVNSTNSNSPATSKVDHDASMSSRLTLSPSCLSVDVIATFHFTLEELFKSDGRSQERFEVKVPVKPADIDPVALFNRELFPRIRKTLKKLGWSTDRLIKISTCSNWSLYSHLTGEPSLVERGHPCKWYFAGSKDDLDSWERYLIERYKFGTAADLECPQPSSLKSLD